MLKKPASAVAAEKMMGIDGPNVRHFNNLEEVQEAVADQTITWEECVAANAELGVTFSFEDGKVAAAYLSEDSVVVDRAVG